MRSFGSIWLYLQYQIARLVVSHLHINTRYKLVNINVYITYNAFLNTMYITMRLKLQGCQRLQ